MSLYTLYEGCYSTGSCSAQVEVIGAIYYPAFTCAAYSSTGGSVCNSAGCTGGYATCDFTSCSTTPIIASACSATYSSSACSGDTFIYLYDSAGTALAYNDDSCGVCSQITYTPTVSSCVTYNVREACYNGGACGATLWTQLACPAGQYTVATQIYATGKFTYSCDYATAGVCIFMMSSYSPYFLLYYFSPCLE